MIYITGQYLENNSFRLIYSVFDNLDDLNNWLNKIDIEEKKS